MAGRFSVETVFKAVDQITKPIRRMQTSVERMTRSASRNLRKVNDQMSKLGAGIRSVGLAAGIALAPLGVAMADVVKVGADFEQTLTNAAAKFPGGIRRGTEAFRALEMAAKQTGKTTEFSASQSAEALNFLAMAGFDAESAIAALPGVVNLATAAQVDLATATDVASDALGAFGLMTKDAAQLGTNLARVNDVIARTTTSANTTVESLFETIKDGAPVATTAGASLETFAALAGEMANAGIKGSQAGTTLKNVFLGLSAPTAGASKILRRLGVQTADTEGNMRDVIDILEDLGKSLDGLGTAQRSGVLEGIFGKIPIAGVNVLLASGSDRLREYRAQLEGAEGASRNMADTMRDTVLGRFRSLMSAVEGVKIELFSMNRGPLAETIDFLTEWVRANEAVISSGISEFIRSLVMNFDQVVQTGKQIAGVVALYLALSAALKVAQVATVAFNVVNLTLAATMAIIKGATAAYALVVGGLPKVLAAARIAVLALNIAMRANPIGILITLVGGLVAAAATLSTAWEPVKEFFAGIFDSAVEKFNEFRSLIAKGASVFGFEGAAEVIAPAAPVQEMQPMSQLDIDTLDVVMPNMPKLGVEVETPALAPLKLEAVAPDVKPLEVKVDPVPPVMLDVKLPAVPNMVMQQGSEDSAPAANQPTDEVAPITSPQARAVQLQEQRTSTSAEVTIKDETGRAEVTGGELSPNIQLISTGAF